MPGPIALLKPVVLIILAIMVGIQPVCATDTLKVRALNRAFQAQDTLNMYVTADSFSDLLAFQFALKFNSSYLKLDSITPYPDLPLTDLNFGLFNVDQGEIRALWSQLNSSDLGAGTPMFTLHFKALQGGDHLRDYIGIADSILPGYAYNSLFEESPVALAWEEEEPVSSITQVVGMKFVDIKRVANTWGAGWIAYELDCADRLLMSIAVYDSQGKLVQTKEVAFEAGKQLYLLPIDHTNPGLLYVRFETGGRYLTTDRVIVME